MDERLTTADKLKEDNFDTDTESLPRQIDCTAQVSLSAPHIHHPKDTHPHSPP